MKNLKKVLALVLVIASLMGMATMASATKSDDYSDADSITHVEAVDVMSTIGVFDGISGSFSGDSILTREQAAKIITYMILGKDDADALVASVAPYTDVSRDRWSAGSIAYCKNEGILAGVGNGRFEPDGKLTGVAFAKMCLVALGYDPDVEILTGSQWAVNTSKIAIAEAGITSNLSQVSLADEMSREDACQMAFNTLQADMVDYEDRGSIITAGDVTISNKPSKAKPVSWETKWANATENTGINDDKIQQFAEKYFSKLKKDTTTDSFGRPSTTWKYKADEIGTYVDTSKLVQSWTAKASKGDMYSAIGGSIAEKLKPSNTKEYGLKVFVDSSEYRTDCDTDVYFKKNSTAAAGQAVSTASTSNIGVSGNGVLTELYMDDDDNVTVVMINTYLVKATADYNTVTERVNIEPMDIDNKNQVVGNFLPAYISNDDFSVSNVKEGDYLLVTVSFDSKTWGDNKECNLESVTPATIQTATVTEYTEHDDVTMGGTKYSYNKILGEEETGELFTINSDATLVLDTYGYIMCVDDASSSNNFVYISEFDDGGHFDKAPVADAYFTDGTNTEISVNKVTKYTTSTASTSYNKNKIVSAYKTGNLKAGWYTFTGTSGSQYTLRTPDLNRYKESQSVGAYYNSNDTVIKSGSVKFLSNAIVKDTGGTVVSSTEIEKIKANDKTIFVVRNDDGDVNSYTGVSNAPDVKMTSNITKGVKVSWIAKKNSDYVSFVFIDAFDTGADVADVGGTADYMFVLKSTNNETHVGDLTYYKYKVIIDGKEEERWVSSKEDVEKGVLYKNIREDSHGRITGVTEFKDTSRQLVLNMTGGKVERHGSALNIAYTSTEDVDLIVGSKSNINLILGKADSKTNDLLTEYADGESYMHYLNVSASYVSSILSNYKDLGGKVYLLKEDDDSEVIDTLWIYVDDSDEK